MASRCASGSRSSWPQLDLLVNNAGVGVGGEVGTLSLEDWRWIVDINLWGVIYGCHTMVDWLKANPAGAHIVNTASMAAIVSAPGMASYNVTKAGVRLALRNAVRRAEAVQHRRHGRLPVVLSNEHRQERPVSTREAARSGQQADGQLRSAPPSTWPQRILRAIDRKQLYVTVPGVATFFWRLKRLMPVDGAEDDLEAQRPGHGQAQRKVNRRPQTVQSG